jgi:two-component system, NarL family, response regulator DegU
LNSIFFIHPFPIIRNELTFVIKEQFSAAVVHEYETFFQCNPGLLNKDDIIIIYVKTSTTDILNSLTLLQNKGVKIIIWMESSDEIQTRNLFQCGFMGYFSSKIEQVELLEGLDMVFNNTPYIQRKLTSLLFKEYLSEIKPEIHENDAIFTKEITLKNAILTNREWDVLQYLSKGYSNEKIAKELFVTESTIKNHVSSILRKLEVPDRTSAVIKAIKNKWINYISIG